MLPKTEPNEGQIKSRIDQLEKELDQLEGLLKITCEKLSPVMLYGPPQEVKPEMPAPLESSIETILRQYSRRIYDIMEIVQTVNRDIRL